MVAVDQLGTTEGVDRTQGGHGDGAAVGPARRGGRWRRGWRRPALVVGGPTALVALPLVLALVTLRDPRWYPLVDMAQIEMRVRDVGLANPPLLGLGGRIFGLDTQGSHPGPLAFYALAPVYRLLGGSAWALQAAGATLNVVAIGGAVWIARRRAGTPGALAAAGGMALLVHFYGLGLLTTPWNPYVPMLWWAVFLLAVWSLLCGDLPLLPVAVVAGSVAAQTHLPYVGLVGGMGAVTVAALVVTAVRHPELRPRLARWGAGAAGLGVVLWLPPIVEQLRGDGEPGNLSIILDSVRNPVEATVGLGDAVRLWLAHLDPVELLTQRFSELSVTGSRVNGALLLVAWLASVAVAVRLVPRQAAGRRGLLRLHLVTAAALLLGLVTISRIAGVPWPYLMSWARGTAALTLATAATTGVLAVTPAVRNGWAAATARTGHTGGADDDGIDGAPLRPAEDAPHGRVQTSPVLTGPGPAESLPAGPVPSRPGPAEPLPAGPVRTDTAPAEPVPSRPTPVGPTGLVWRWLPGAALVALVLVPVALTALEAPDAAVPDRHNGDEGAALGRLAPAVVAALTDGDTPDHTPRYTGDTPNDPARSVGDTPDDAALTDGSTRTVDAEADPRYVVTWQDPVGLGAAGFGLLLELERHGIDAGVPGDSAHVKAVRDHRTLDADQADAVIHVSVGDGDIEQRRRRDDARELAAVDPRTPAQRAEVRRLERHIAETLVAAGHDDLAAQLDTARFSVEVDERLPDGLELPLMRLKEIPQPLAVFVASPS